MADRKLKIDLALIHYPVCNRNRETIGSAVTNLDIHDIARTGRTYGIDRYYLVTPFADQQRLAGEILDYWRTGHGATYNPLRREALELVEICDDLASLYDRVTAKWGERPTVLATSAAADRTVDYEAARERIMTGEPVLLLFGTGWGMTPELLAETDGLLPPLHGVGQYNHLSVRSAAAIILDRLLGGRD